MVPILTELHPPRQALLHRTLSFPPRYASKVTCSTEPSSCGPCACVCADFSCYSSCGLERVGAAPCYLPSASAVFSRLPSLQRAFSGRCWRELKRPIPIRTCGSSSAFPAGGPTDAIARILGERLTEKWGQSVVIENRGGAGGNIATRQVAKAEANGYTVLVTTSAYAVNPSLTANAGYVPETDFKTAIVAATSPNIIVAAAGLKASNLKELLEAREDRETHLRHAGARHHAAPLRREALQGAGQGRHSACAVHRRGAAPQRARSAGT